MPFHKALYQYAGLPIFRIFTVILCITLIADIRSLSAEDETLESLSVDGAPQTQTEPDKPVSFVASTPTIPLPPPILPSFYNNPTGLDQVYAGRSLSHIFSVCGDGIYDPGEECDDGNRDGEDGCSDLCRLEDPLSCGDGKVGPGERCDDGNLGDGDGCSATCQSEGMCGDGAVDPGEECDDGNKSSADGCSRMCFRETTQDAEEKDPEVTKEDPLETDAEDPVTIKEEKEDENSDPDDEEDEIKTTPREPTVSYEQGRAVTTISSCTGSCTMEVTRNAEGQIISSREILSERKLDVGATYTDPVFGEVNCATGTGVAMSENSAARFAESSVRLKSAVIVSCRA